MDQAKGLTMGSSRRGRVLGCVLAGLGGLVALTYVMATSTEVEAYMERDGQLVRIAGGYRPVAIVLVTIQAVAAVAALVGLVAAARKSDRVATRSLGVAAIAGLVPALLPGVLAFFARVLVMRSSRPA
jgi:hypothetical protein